ncbi:Putative uncharacterized protein [Moritella viscosa]|uniref:Uncharacterized protein n=1 Tax=Moritella viscosa TaxID=80854 RepID=A0A1L0AS75_9GAMM|nr:Putative uncharacterized protein [Moritella viscosa]
MGKNVRIGIGLIFWRAERLPKGRYGHYLFIFIFIFYLRQVIHED